MLGPESILLDSSVVSTKHAWLVDLDLAEPSLFLEFVCEVWFMDLLSGYKLVESL